MLGRKGWAAGGPSCGPLAWALLRTTVWKPLWAEGLDPTDPTHATPIPDSAPRSQGPRSAQELLVAALAPVLCQAVCCTHDAVFSLNLCQALRGGAIIPMSQVRKLRLGRMDDFLGARQSERGSWDSNPHESGSWAQVFSVCHTSYLESLASAHDVACVSHWACQLIVGGLFKLSP